MMSKKPHCSILGMMLLLVSSTGILYVGESHMCRSVHALADVPYEACLLPLYHP